MVYLFLFVLRSFIFNEIRPEFHSINTMIDELSFKIHFQKKRKRKFIDKLKNSNNQSKKNF